MLRNAVRRLFRQAPFFEVMNAVYSSEPKPAIAFHALLHQASGHGPLVRDLLERLKSMKSAEAGNATHLLIVVLGPCDPAEFRREWNRQILMESALGAWIAGFKVAELGCDSPAGEKTFHSLYEVPLV